MRLDTKQKRLNARGAEIEHLKSTGGTVEKTLDLIIVRYMLGDKPCLKVYSGTGYHPAAHYSYRTTEQREKAVDSCVASAKRHKEYKDQQRQARKQFKPSIQAGDILCDSWGYDQTNIDFFQVLSVQGLAVVIQEIGHTVVKDSEGFMCCRVLPDIGQFLKDSTPEKKRICQGDCIRTSDYGRYAHKWDGSEKYCSWYA